MQWLWLHTQTMYWVPLHIYNAHPRVSTQMAQHVSSTDRRQRSCVVGNERGDIESELMRRGGKLPEWLIRIWLTCILRVPKLRANLEVARGCVMANGVGVSEMTNRRELRTFRDGDALNGGTPQVWDLSTPVPRPRGREFLRVGELPRSPWCWGLRWKLEGFNCACNRNCAILKLHTGAARSQDCALVPRNLEIA